MAAISNDILYDRLNLKLIGISRLLFAQTNTNQVRLIKAARTAQLLSAYELPQARDASTLPVQAAVLDKWAAKLESSLNSQARMKRSRSSFSNWA